MNVSNEFLQEVQSGQRFEFGKNWQRFLTQYSDERLAEAKKSLCRMLRLSSLEGKRFLDIGCGSGLFSLAAKALGASVVSFDYDPSSVHCAMQLKDKCYANDEDWVILNGSVLDSAFMMSLGQFDVVYSWGVLHHTGAMAEAIDLAQHAVASGGLFYMAIYNEQPLLTGYWKGVKRAYNASPSLVKPLWAFGFSVFFMLSFFIADILKGKNPARRYQASYKRGMTVYRDIVDWIGGWPFEAATPEAVVDHLAEKKFVLTKIKTCLGKHGCNEFVFTK